MTKQSKNNDNLPVIYIKANKSRFIQNRHPWIFSGALVKEQLLPVDGALVKICVEKTDQFLAIGHFQSEGSISVRILSFKDEIVDRNFYISKIEKAYKLRQTIIDFSSTNCYRLIHGEGDGLSGLIVDVYSDHIVFQCHSKGMLLQRQVISEALESVVHSVKTIYCKSSSTIRDGSSQLDCFMIGETESTVVKESGILMEVNWVHGQKTGTFLDQRANRAILQTMSTGKSILDLFCNNGGFTLNALKGNAAKVTSVDSSEIALQRLKENISLNDFDRDKLNVHQSDCLSFLSSTEELFDIVICDPPAFAKSLAKKHKAVQGYKRLNIEALKSVKPGGFCLTFSCSQAVDEILFYNTIVSAAMEIGREVKVLSKLQQGLDHPVNIFHKEGSYLKGLFLYVV